MTKMKCFLLTVFATCFGYRSGFGASTNEVTKSKLQPNIILIFLDDVGYADFGCFGARGYRTPHMDRLAREGMKFTDFHAAQGVCSASRAGLMTGCYPNRVGIIGALMP